MLLLLEVGKEAATFALDIVQLIVFYCLQHAGVTVVARRFRVYAARPPDGKRIQALLTWSFRWLHISLPYFLSSTRSAAG